MINERQIENSIISKIHYVYVNRIIYARKIAQIFWCEMACIKVSIDVKKKNEIFV